MPFMHVGSQLPDASPTYKELPLKSGVAFSDGDVVRIEDGRYDLCASGESAYGVLSMPEDRTGNAGGTIKGHAIVLAPGMLFQVAQTGTDGNTDPGSRLDLNATSDGVTTDSNHDVTVVRQDTVKDLLVVSFNNRQVA